MRRRASTSDRGRSSRTFGDIVLLHCEYVLICMLFVSSSRQSGFGYLQRFSCFGIEKHGRSAKLGLRNPATEYEICLQEQSIAVQTCMRGMHCHATRQDMEP